MKVITNHCFEKRYLTNVYKTVIVILSIFLVQSISAQTNYYYKGSGALQTTTNWTTNATGSGGSSPANFTTNNQVFNMGNTSTSSFTLTLSASWNISGTGSQLVIPNGTTFTAASTLSTPTLTIQSGGSVQANSAVTVNTAFNINNGGTYIHNNTGNTTTTIFAGTETFGVSSNFQIINWESLTRTLFQSVTPSAAPGDGNTYYYGNLIINWAMGSSNTWTQDATLGTAGNYYLAAGNVTFSSAVNGTFQLNKSNAAPNVYVYGSFTFSPAATAIFDFATKNVNVAFNVRGNISQTSGTITTSGHGSASIGLLQTWGVGPVSNQWSFTGGTRAYVAYTITSGVTTTLTSNFDMSNQNLSGFNVMLINSGGTFDAQNYVVQSSGGGSPSNPTFDVNGTLRTSNTNGLFGSTTTTLSNSPVQLTFNPGSGSTVEYYATGSQNVTAATNYENVTILGGGTKTLQGASTINKALTLTSGKLDIQNYVLTIPSTGSVAGYTTSNYIVTGSGTGRLRQEAVTSSNYNTTKYFPIGTASCYLPVATNPTATSDFTVNVFTGATTDGTSGGTLWTSAQKKGMVDAVWNVERKSDRIAISGTAVNTFQWDNCYSSLEGTEFAAAANSLIGIWRWVSGTSWSLSSVNFTSNNSDAGGFNTSGNTISSTYPGPYIVAIITSPLANNHFIKFEAVPVNNDVILNWQVDNTTDLKSFEIEKSYDGSNFLKLSAVSINPNTNYSYADKNVNSGIVYYRIKMFTASDGYAYSNTIAVTIKSIQGLKIKNNPVVDKLEFVHPQTNQGAYRLITLDGKPLISGKVAANSTTATINMQSLSKGIYLLQYIDGGNISTEKIIKQ